VPSTLTEDANVAQCIVLNAISSMPFHGFTYPSLQTLLYSAGSGEVTAVGAMAGGEAVGLALALDLPHKGFTRVASLFVREDRRRQGHGTRLLAALEDELRRRGVARAEVSYQTGRATTAAVARLLEKREWPEARPDRLMCRCDRRMLDSDWLSRDYPQTRGGEIVSWSDVRPEEVEALKASQASHPWIPESLRPWEYEDIEFNSVALRYKGAIAGWVLTQRHNSTTLIYSNSYMHPTLQRAARILPLYVKAVRQQAADPALPNAVWVVPFIHPTMVRFVREWMTPYMKTVEELRVSVKELAPA
jgi:GNAT superfamily N-acetyltransferase